MTTITISMAKSPSFLEIKKLDYNVQQIKLVGRPGQHSHLSTKLFCKYWLKIL